MPKRKLLLLAVTFALVIALVACDPISGTAGTGYNPTPQPHGQALEQNVEMLEAAAATREAR